MATLSSVDNSGIDLSAFNLVTITTGIPTTKTASDYVLPNAEFRGFNFAYTDRLIPTRLRSVPSPTSSVTTGGPERYEITGLLLDVADVDKF